MSEGKLLTQKEAADRLGLSTRFLELRRYEGGGPPFGRVTCRSLSYRPADLEARAAERAGRAGVEVGGRQGAEAMREAEDGDLERHFIVRITAEGRVIEIIDADDQPLFASASAEPAPILLTLIDVLVPVLGETDETALDRRRTPIVCEQTARVAAGLL